MSSSEKINPKAISNEEYKPYVEAWLKKNKPKGGYDTTPIEKVHFAPRIKSGTEVD